jgi:hypothetical protein
MSEEEIPGAAKVKLGRRWVRLSIEKVPKDTQSPSSEDGLAALKSVAEAGTVLAAVLFVGGWSYMAAYYLAFGLNPFELDFSVPAISAFSIHMLRNAVWPLPAASVLLIVLLFWYKRLRGDRHTWVALCLAALLLTFATAGTLRGRALARQDMLETSSSLPNVGFVAKLKGLEPDCLGEGTMDCKLLLHAKSTYYFFKPISVSDSASIHDWNLNVYMAHDSEIVAVHLQRGLE